MGNKPNVIFFIFEMSTEAIDDKGNNTKALKFSCQLIKKGSEDHSINDYQG